MENDSIRASGSNTLVDIWVNGKLRALTVTKAAIETYLGMRHPEGTTEDDRCEFVRTHLPRLAAAVKEQLAGNPTAEAITIESGQLGGVGDRRKAERRKADRRKLKTPTDKLPQGERRRSQRRTTERRQPNDG